ncbi:MAG: hypothetical protein ACOX9R_17930 [Armatimonadota bacterium]|jgi:hypothetical protein
MRRRSTALTALIAIVLVGTCIAANAQSVRFVTPEDGDTVRDIVRVQATKPSPNEGWISYKVERGGDGEFVAAVTSPFTYPWDTGARDAEGKELYPDGQYTLTAVALSPSGQKVGEASITVTLRNAVSAGEAPQQVDLQLFYERNAEVYYRADGDWSLRPASDEEKPEDAWEMAKQFDGALVAEWKNKVMSPTYAAGHALLHVIVGSAGAQAGESDVERLDRSGDVITYRALRDGEMRRKHSDQSRFELAEITIPLPDRPIKVGDSWQGRIQVWPDPLKGTGAAPGMGMEMEMGMGPEMMMDPGMMMYGDEMGMGMAAAPPSAAPRKTETQTLRATHRVEAFEWVGGYPTARIRSTFTEGNAKVTVPGGPSAGAMGGMGDEFGGPMGEMGMFGDMGLEGDMGMGMGGQSAERDSSYVGERITNWSWDLNRPVRIADTITHTLEIERGMQMSGMEGMMDGMPMEMMDPGMMDPGAWRRGMDPRMGGWDEGMFGGGMMMQQQAEPLKINIQVKLTIQEVNR